jgi:hypothetical protein
MALHDLFTVESDSHRDAEALRYAQAALDAYPVGHPDLVALDAEGVLESVRSERSADTALHQAEPATLRKAPPADQADMLARELVESLEASSVGR